MALAGRRSLGGGVEDQSLYGAEVIEHGPVCAVRVAAADGRQDAAVILMRAPGAAAGEQALLAALPEEVDERAHDPDDGAIVGSGRDGRVERRVFAPARAPLPPLPRLLGEDPLHLADLLGRRATGS